MNVCKVNNTITYEEMIDLIKNVTSNIFDLEEDTNMLELGITSLQIMRLANRFKKMGYKITFTELIKNPSPISWWSKLNNQKRNIKETSSSVSKTENKQEDSFELTDVQHAYWVGRKDSQPLGGVSCHAYFEFDTKDIDLKLLSGAWHELQLLHPMLRACFKENGKQKILDHVFSDKIKIYDFREVGKDEGMRKQKELKEQLSHRRLDIENGQVAEFGVSILCDNTMKMHFDIDLLVADLQSLQIIFKDIERLYNGKDIKFEERWDFKQYLIQESEFNLKEKEASKTYWKENIENLPLAPKVPLYKKPDDISKHRFVRRKKFLPKESWDALKTRARTEHTTPAMLLITAYAETVDRWSENSKFLINIPMYNRQAHSKEIEKVVSDFTNIMILPVDCTKNMTFLERVKSIQDKFYECAQFTTYSGIQLQRDLVKLHRGEKFIAPFVFSCNYGEPLVNDDFIKTFGELTYMITQTPQVWNDFQVYEINKGLLLAWDTVDEIFPNNMMNEMFEYFSQLIDYIIENPNDRIEESCQEENAVDCSNKYIDSTNIHHEDKCIHEMFFEHAKTNGQKIAVVDSESGKEYSYSQLSDYALKIAAYLNNIGVTKGDLVSISLPRGIEQISSILGVVSAGAAYVPVSVEQPFTRRKSIYEKASIKYIITDLEHKSKLQWPEDNVVIDIETIMATSIGKLNNEVSPKDCAYIIFTSGSTGSPKGVKISHAAAWNTIKDINQKYNVNSEDAVLAISSFDFDLSVYDIFGLLSVGGRIVLVPEREKRNSFFWLKAVKNFNVTIWNSVPTLLNMLLIVAENGSHSIAPIRLALISGDWIELNLPVRYDALTEEARFIALGGATEASIWSNYFEIKLPLPTEWTSIPYGRALSNQAYRVCDKKGRDCPNWASGELLIGGKGVADGYIGEPELTRKAFIIENGVRWYKTGDMGRFWPDGTIEFLGRKDEQVKIRGHRIEIAEIEKALCKHFLISNAVAFPVGEQKGNKYLIAAVVLKGKYKKIIKELDKSELDKFLLEYVPDYMLPKHVEVLEECPLTSNGKVDRKQLSLIVSASNKKCNAIENDNTSHTETQILLSKIWSEVLGCGKVDLNSNYFELGGDSLIATRLCTKLNEAFNIKIQIESIFKYPKFLEQSEHIDELLKDKDFSTKENLPKIVSNNEEKYLPFSMTDIQKAYWIGRKGVYSFGEVATHYYFELEEENLDIDKLTNSWNRLIKHHDMMRAVILEDGENQKILENVRSYDIKGFDLTQSSSNDLNDHVAKIRDDMGHQKFDETTWPLFDVKVTNMPKNKSRIHISFDNIIYDGWSIFMILSQWNQLYRNENIPLRPLDVSFRDYVMSLQKIKKSDLYQKDKEYWEERIKTLPPAPELPIRKRIEPSKNYKFTHMETKISCHKWNKIKEYGKKYGVTPSVILLTAYSEVICAYSKKPDYTLNLTRFNRLPLHEQIDEMVGDFTSLTLLSIHNRKGDTFVERCGNIQTQLSKDLAHPYLCGVEVQREISRQHGKNAGAVMPIVFTSAIGLNNKQVRPDRRWIGKRVYTCSETPQVWLDHQVIEENEELILIWDFAEGLFPENMIEEMFQLYSDFIENLGEGNEKWNCTKNIISIPRNKKVMEANNTDKPISNSTLIDLFYKSVDKYPNEEAVVTSDIRLTYQEVFEKAKSVAAYLREADTKKGDKVSIIMEKGWEQIVAVLGILMTGAAYIPIDPNYPKKRVEYILRETNSKVAFTQKWLKEKLSYIDTISILDIDEACLCNTESLGKEISISPEDLAYIIYTSGSTGKPKGVMIDHKGAVNTIVDINERFNVKKDRIFGLTSLTFDLSVYDIFGALASGSTIILIDRDKLKDPLYWVEIMKKEKVTIWNSVPQFMQMLIEYVANRKENIKIELRLALLSGDWIPLDLPEKMKKYFEGIKVVGLGGATEASIWSNLYIINDVNEKWESIPYGKPMVNQRFYIMNELLNDSPIWVPGTLFIGGVGVAKGYLNDEEKTKIHFIKHPKTGERIYCTGDLGRYLPDGNIEFLGREDSQVKVGGHRIEMGEIEHALDSVDGIKQSIVTTIREENSSQHLIANLILNHSDPEVLTKITISNNTFSKVDFKRLSSNFEMNNVGNDITTKSHKLESYFQHCEKLSVCLIHRILKEIGAFEYDEYNLEQVMSQTGIDEKFTGLIKNWYKILEREKVVYDNEGVFLVNRDMMEAQLEVAECSTTEIEQKDTEIKNLSQSLEKFFSHDISGYVDILRGKKSMAELFLEKDDFFNPKKVGTLNPLQKDFEAILIKTVLELLECEKGNKIRVIEIGSRTNELASFIDSKLGKYDCEYVYTDASKYLLNEAKKKNLEYVTYSQLNMNDPIVEQGYSSSSVDVVIANNALHRSRNIYETLGYIGEMLKPGGILLLLEPVYNSNLALSTVGLYEEGFSNYQDFRKKTMLPLLSKEKWESVLNNSNYEVYSIPIENINSPYEQYVCIARNKKTEEKIDCNGIKKILKEKLPSYMIPNIFIESKNIPLTSNGKVDRQKIEQSNRKLSKKINNEGILPKTQIQQCIFEVWQKVLKCKNLSITDNFFELGGDSISAIQCINSLKNDYNMEVSIKDLFETSTIKELETRVNILEKENEDIEEGKI
ncbi:amino acid adenylation domain-containing protein [Haloimpatiens sp. FM7330]|uniref:amino acid adenylation domain-containing protein n=1 Tax=Haloimpatiens sp. FM7330 TaxID=3298610 RepID=UPI003638DD75